MSLFPWKSNEDSLFEIVKDFTSLFFPEFCLGCSENLLSGEDIICTKCLLHLPRTDYLTYQENPIYERFIGRLPIKFASAFLRFRKAGIVQHLLHQLKYNNHPEVGLKLGMLFGEELNKYFTEMPFDLIIPVPLFSSRQRNRGYNQSSKFAEGISNATNVPFDESCCMRTYNTTTQTRKTKSERWQNVNQAFLVTNENKIINKHVLLVDDVMTTGATLEACGTELIKRGCASLSIACIAEAQ